MGFGTPWSRREGPSGPSFITGNHNIPNTSWFVKADDPQPDPLARLGRFKVSGIEYDSHTTCAPTPSLHQTPLASLELAAILILPTPLGLDHALAMHDKCHRIQAKAAGFPGAAPLCGAGVATLAPAVSAQVSG